MGKTRMPQLYLIQCRSHLAAQRMDPVLAIQAWRVHRSGVEGRAKAKKVANLPKVMTLQMPPLARNQLQLQVRQQLRRCCQQISKHCASCKVLVLKSNGNDRNNSNSGTWRTCNGSYQASRRRLWRFPSQCRKI